MKRLQRKLQSQSGASILLALLLFLVCAMVSASILAAAVSNAGKARSNRVEQQKYLTLSSAIRLIADEIQKAESGYTGKYKVYEWAQNTGTAEEPVWVNYFYVEQQEGDFICGDLADTTAVFPLEILLLRAELDEIFSRQFTAKGGEASGYKPLAGVEGSIPRVLTVALPLKEDGTVDLEGYPDSGREEYQAQKEVKVEVVLNHDTHHIMLTTWLGSADSPNDLNDTMVAELVAKNAPALTYAPVGRTAGTSRPDTSDPAIKVDKDGEETPAAGAPMKWELNWIKKGAVE